MVTDQTDSVGTVDEFGDAWLDAIRTAHVDPEPREEVVASVMLAVHASEIELYGVRVLVALGEVEIG